MINYVWNIILGQFRLEERSKMTSLRCDNNCEVTSMVFISTAMAEVATNLVVFESVNRSGLWIEILPIIKLDLLSPLKGRPHTILHVELADHYQDFDALSKQVRK